METLVQQLQAAGWVCAVEASFSVFGERGSVDILAFHGAAATVLVVEVKTVIPVAQSMLATHDRKLRLAVRIAADRGWNATVAARLLVAPEDSTSRRRVAALGQSFAAAYPVRGLAVRRWLKAPDGPISGLLFVPDAQVDGGKRPATGRKRVKQPRQGPAATE